VIYMTPITIINKTKKIDPFFQYFQYSSATCLWVFLCILKAAS